MMATFRGGPYEGASIPMEAIPGTKSIFLPRAPGDTGPIKFYESEHIVARPHYRRCGQAEYEWVHPRHAPPAHPDDDEAKP